MYPSIFTFYLYINVIYNIRYKQTYNHYIYNQDKILLKKYTIN